jgi:hypothetical protein
MVSKIYWLVCLIYIQVICFSQQALIAINSGPTNLSNYSPTFESRFNATQNFVSFDNKTDFYHSKKVKIVEITSRNGTVLWRLRLDKNGAIVNTGFRSHGHFIEKETYSIDKDINVEVKRFYDEHHLIRIDSITRLTKRYINEDTVIEYQCIDIQNYRIGYLINEQNRYFNSNYLSKPIDYDNLAYYYHISFSPYSSTSTSEQAPPNYYDVAYKTDYDSLTLYYCQSKRDVYHIYGFTKSDERGFELDNHNQHPFILQKNSEYLNECFVDGICFNEPVYRQERMYCGSSNYGYYYNNGHSNGYHSDEKGLYKEYYSEYYPEDTAATNAAKKIQISKDSLAETTIHNANYLGNTSQFYFVKRLDTPIRTETYYYRYVFYE